MENALLERKADKLLEMQKALGGTIDSHDAAKFLGLKNAKTLYHWRRKGIGPCYMSYGRLIRYAIADLSEWQASKVVIVGRDEARKAKPAKSRRTLKLARAAEPDWGAD